MTNWDGVPLNTLFAMVGKGGNGYGGWLSHLGRADGKRSGERRPLSERKPTASRCAPRYSRQKWTVEDSSINLVMVGPCPPSLKGVGLDSTICNLWRTVGTAQRG